jgi:hypothetical protein
MVIDYAFQEEAEEAPLLWEIKFLIKTRDWFGINSL